MAQSPGLLGMMGQGESPFANWLDPRRNFLQQTFAGMVGADDTRGAMRGAVQGAAQGGQMDTVYNQLQEEQARNEEAVNQTAQWIQQMAQQNADPRWGALAQGLQSGAMDPGSAFSSAIQLMQPAQGPDQTSAMQNYEYLISQGVPGADAMERAFGGGGTTVNVGQSEFGTIPPGYELFTDPATGARSMQPIAGGPAAAEAAEAAAQQGAQQDAQQITSDVITGAAATARALASRPGTTGVQGALLANLSETEAAELRRQVGVLTSVGTIESLNAMRQQSPTGGALGNVTEGEGRMLASAAGAIDPNSSPTQFQQQLDNYERTLLRIIHGPGQGDTIFEQTRAQSGGGAAGAPRTTSTGVTWSF